MGDPGSQEHEKPGIVLTYDEPFNDCDHRSPSENACAMSSLALTRSDSDLLRVGVDCGYSTGTKLLVQLNECCSVRNYFAKWQTLVRLTLKVIMKLTFLSSS